MDIDSPPKVHISIQKELSIPRLQKCSNCCVPAQYHCPFCLPTFFKPTKLSRARLHLENHLKRAIYFGEYTIHRCGLECRNQQHYHCLYCPSTLIRKRDFISHLPLCYKSKRRQARKLLQTDGTQGVYMEGSPTRGEFDITSYNIFCPQDTDDDSDELTFITDSDDQNSYGASSSQLVTQFVECDAVGICHRAVQTSAEKPQDCDEFYFMSLVKMFKKLAPSKKADVRMKIERLLFEAEFE